ncbi:hypothetical protein SCLCIDRAFT_139502 [Scleroderma citrinum Foug A]|uniref:C2H2-type domain-containing protein n=1 Tax=Scleroderma citrinum Foug A TaxID=1036808 RepID=A0A0C2YU39_9AGAM|nr:hypothetical protein SCLCIDRAFT_139502 [Scleroderma citrinum Foug A]
METNPTLSTTVLGKRRVRNSSLVLRLSSSPAPSESSGSAYTEVSDAESDTGTVAGPPTRTSTPDLPPGPSVGQARYPCTYSGCSKSYSKPSRLSEHYRSHTGERPYVCEECGKSYLRETHLHAHNRSHLPESKKPYVCNEFPGCTKRFWTLQHLHLHENTHRGEKSYVCTEEGCEEAFVKHYQLRAHICGAHSLPGTKPYICSHPSCSKSFSTNQKLQGHLKSHEDKRYTCSHPNCLPTTSSDPVYFGTWTALQSHIRTTHPPTCIHASCNSRTFASLHNLRAHLKLHEQREAEALRQGGGESDGELSRARKRRRGGELGRDWKCDYSNCGKDFKSKRALTTHHNVIHLGQRNHVCPHLHCDSAFGYKHLLERHLAKIHTSKDSQSHSDEETTDPGAATGVDLDIEEITGKAYIHRSQNLKSVRCPYPHIEDLLASPSDSMIPSASSSATCEHVLTRSYDLRRHLKAEHGVLVDKGKVDEWVRAQKLVQAA